jgi:hypothetical protein
MFLGIINNPVLWKLYRYEIIPVIVLVISDSYWKCVAFNGDLKVEHISRNLHLIMYQSMYTFRHTKSEQIWSALFSTISVKVHQSTRCVILQLMFVVVRFGNLQMKRKICITWVTIRYSRRTLPMDIVTPQGSRHISTVGWSFCLLTIKLVSWF